MIFFSRMVYTDRMFTLNTLFSRCAVMAVRGYQLWISPMLPRVCRFTPTCSDYYIEAVGRYGFWSGSLRGFWRILRCNPWCRGGHDPP